MPAGETGGDGAQGAQPPTSEAMSTCKTRLLGAYLIASFLAQIALLVGFWPAVDASGKWKQTWVCWAPTSSELRRVEECPIADDARLIVIVLLSGGVGAMVHALRSFSIHVGAGELSRGWAWWYVLRPFEGATIALAFYLVLRGGLINAGGSGQSTAETVSIYGMAGLAVLVGLFSQEAVTKMKELAETLFTKATIVVGDNALQQAQPKPMVAGASPAEIKQGTADAKITVSGTGFSDRSKVHIAGTSRETTFKSATELVATLAPADTAEAGKESMVTVVTPPPGGGESEKAVTIRVTT